MSRRAEMLIQSKESFNLTQKRASASDDAGCSGRCSKIE